MKSSVAPQRVVSLLGAATETIHRLGLGDQLVGRSHECDYPPVVLSLPMISKPRLDVESPSASIDAAVREQVKAGETVYALDDEQLSLLAPDLLITQDHCRVCAVTPRDVANSVTCSSVRQLVLKPATLNDCLGDVQRVAVAMGFPERGDALRATLEARLQRVRELSSAATGGASDQSSPRAAPFAAPRVAVLEWCDPIMGCGYWIPELVRLAGGVPVHCSPPGGATPTLTFSALLEGPAAPDVVIFALCGFSVARSAREIAESWGAQQLEALLAACGKENCFVVDGNYLVNRSGPRVVESAEAFAECAHPALRGHFGHLGTPLLATLSRALAEAEADVGRGKVRPPPVPSPSRCCGGGGAESTSASGSPADAVAAQLVCLSSHDFVGAFRLNSAANQARWCSADRFEAVLKGHAAFGCLLLPREDFVGECGPSLHEVSAARDDGTDEEGNGGGLKSRTTAAVRVTLPSVKPRGTAKEAALAPKAASTFTWTMVKEEGAGGDGPQWRTEKVG
uniref:Fe/B12 periplasmic-binding domain-containing protein n=1 Tax=Octactis speculum TaxID=3111310 RepID=A0A7S2B6C4_9STRA|mmetsp:Transcript_20128/g.27362  ORF Transcript_20128/g.27362 Transcript_20128/m.27362 type:complete len:512 (+) Transcript_20128:105-1640(+)